MCKSKLRDQRGVFLPYRPRIFCTALVAATTVMVPKPAVAEFEIQESQVEKGEVELEYRGAVHWGFPEDASGAEQGALAEEAEAEFVRQSHDLELEYGLTERWLFATTLSADEPLDADFNVSSVELELQYELVQREGNGIGLAFQTEYGFATRGGDPDEYGFGPIVELATGNLLLTFNPLFTGQVGDNRQTDGLGFEYGWRAEYDFAKHWGIGVEMFGEIEDLSNAGSFNDQTHSLGPTLFYNPGEDSNEHDKKGADDDEVAGAASMEFALNVGVQQAMAAAEMAERQFKRLQEPPSRL